MDIKDVEKLLHEYPLNSFVGTPSVMSVDTEQMVIDMEKTLSKSIKDYLYCLSDLIKHNYEFFSNKTVEFSSYISRLIGTTSALKEIIQLTEDVTNIFENEFSWTRGLAIRGMLTILDTILQELNVVKRQITSSRFINRLRQKVRLIIWEKIPKTINILSLMVAVQSEQATTNEVLAAIGNAGKIVKTC